MRVNYFAFGSNLSSPRLLERIPRASRHCVAVLHRHQLCWHKKGRDLSGKCNVVFTGDGGDAVYGVVYQMMIDEQFELDIYESDGVGYERRQVRVSAVHGASIHAFTYYALEIEAGRQPYHWYKEHVLRGAREHGLPEHYVDHIRKVPSIDDHDAERHRRELSIYLDDE